MGVEPVIEDQEQRYALAARAADEGLWDWDLEKNEIYFSPRWKSMLGFGEEEIGTNPDEWLDRVYEKDLGHLLGKLSDHLYRGAARFASEHRILHRDGTYRWVLSRGIALRGESGKATRIVGSQTDITDRKRTEDRLRHDASHDALTGLPNRAYFGLQLQRAATRIRSHPNRLFAVLILDLDGFKKVNDNWGHQAGDRLLKSVAERLQASVRPGDVVARLGGDEFGLLLRNLREPHEVIQVAKRIQTELAVPLQLGGEEISPAASIGMALGSGPYEKAGDLIRNADAAMYRAKQRGRSQYEFFEPRPAGEGLDVLVSEAGLRQSLQSGEFKLLYQPYVSLLSGTVKGCEVLLRRQEPAGGFVPARDLVEAAGDSGMVLPISEWVFSRACSQVKAWERAGLGRLMLCINVSAAELNHPKFGAVVRRALEQSGLDPSRLRLEFSESALTQSSEPGLSGLKELCAGGARAYLDDFGAAYSSLIFLRRYPISGVKIDESLLRSPDAHSTEDTGASGLIELAHSMGLEVALGGVESLEQIPLSSEHKYDHIQGRIVSQPLEADRCEAFLRENQTDPVSARLGSCYSLETIP